MKKFVFLILIAILWSSGCGTYDSGYTGDLNRGTKGRALSYVETPPSGMVYIPSGPFLLGVNDQDITQSLNANVKTITIDAFWMDQTEITNFEYRQFVNYVRDSTARRLLAEQLVEFTIEDESAMEEEMQPVLNWRTPINYRNEEQREILNSMNYSPEESMFGRREVDVRRLVYEYAWIDVVQAAKARYDYDQQSYVGTIINAKGEEEEVKNRGSFIVRDRTLVYPDTLCWIRDFIYSYNEPFATRYFWHPAYNDYPVVGVTWKQATAFCHWRTDMMENSHNKYNKGHNYRLPSEVEWEYAARGGLQGQLYPWGGLYTTNREGCYLANFKPQRGKYDLDGGVRTVPVGSYDPNDYGLYDMAGNVAEWTANAYDENSYSFYHDIMPSFTYNAKATDPGVKRRKTIRGGSWKDIAYFLQCGARTFEYQDSARSFIGFRCVRHYMGTR
jgi:gliding motility-associated lipoprotein GldK